MSSDLPFISSRTLTLWAALSIYIYNPPEIEGQDLVRVRNHCTRWTWVWWIKVGPRCNKTPSYSARSYTEVLPAGCLLGRREPAGTRRYPPVRVPSSSLDQLINMDKGTEGITHIIGDGERIDISMWYSLFPFGLGNNGEVHPGKTVRWIRG